jgi:hypothetical protein
MAAHRRRAPLTTDQRAAAVAVTEAQLAGHLTNAKPFTRDGRLRFRVELEVDADRVEALLAALADPPGPAVG